MLEILMATMHRKNISEIDWIYKNIQTPILLINQSDFSSLEIQDNIRMISCIERGSSNSRNMALNNAIGDICLIADDDVGYVDNAEEIINCAFRDNPSADIITFQIITPEGKPFNKGYPVHKQWHNSRSILRCASIEIAFRKDSIIQAGIKLDVDFGLGSKYRVHDEIIFLKDALDNNLKLLYIPIPIVIHPAESSGTDFNDHLIVSKGAAFVRLFGYKGMFLNILFAIKKHAEYSNKYSFLGFLMKMFEGSIKYIREDFEMNISKCKYLIIGGGASGLMFANTKKNDDIILLEKENELGGYCRTIYQDGFVWDYAGHFFHFANEDIKNFFRSKISDSDLVLREKITKIFYKDLVIDFPFQTNIHQLDKEEFIDCLYDLFFKNESEHYNSFLSMLYGKFGTSITDKFLRPYNEKLYACDLNLLDQNAMGRFFPYADLTKIIRNFKSEFQDSYNSTFLYPRRGAKVFIDALAEDISSKLISVGESVISINVKDKIVTTNKRNISYQFLINSMPFNSLLESIVDINYKDIINTLSWNKVLVLNLGFDKASKYNDIHWSYFPEKEYNFYRVGFYNNILGDERLSLYVEIGFSPNEYINVDEQLRLAILGLKKSGIIDEHKVISYIPIIMDPAYVHVDNKLDSIKDNIKESLSERGVYTIGRYGDWKYCSIEDSMLDAIKISQEI